MGWKIKRGPEAWVESHWVSHTDASAWEGMG